MYGVCSVVVHVTIVCTVLFLSLEFLSFCFPPTSCKARRASGHSCEEEAANEATTDIQYLYLSTLSVVSDWFWAHSEHAFKTFNTQQDDAITGMAHIDTEELAAGLIVGDRVSENEAAGLVEVET